MAAPLDVFISYSRRDEAWLKQLTAAWAPLEQIGIVKPWDDRDIPPGAKWRDAIEAAIGGAQIAVMLVSLEFLASRFIHREELPKILAKRENGLGLFWIPLEATLYEYTPLKDIQSAWPPAQPLKGLDEAALAKAWVDIAKKLAAWKPGQPLD
jgi:internalin A